MRSPVLFLSCVPLFFGSAVAENGKSNDTVGWQSDPNGRGTFTLVSSCMLTLVICVYSAMHLNVPPHGESTLQFWLRNVKWALLGIFGPELVVFNAWQQYLSARTVVKRSQKNFNMSHPSLQKGQNEKQSSLTSAEEPQYPLDPPSQWTIVHGFYAGMGGFMFPLKKVMASSETPTFRSDYKRLTLTARGVALLADCGLLPDIGRKYLDDKSKSDGLSKFIACAQAAWLIVQVIGRLILGLQVTLLEINTLGHVLCALIMYVIWWHKPRMVLEPLPLEGEWMGPLCAYMYMSSRMSGHSMDAIDGSQDAIFKPEISTVAFYPGEQCKHPISCDKCCHNVTSIETLTDSPRKEGQDSDPASSNTSNPPPRNHEAKLNSVTRGSFELRPLPDDWTKRTMDGISRTDHPDESQDSDTGRRQRWRLAAEAIHTYPAIKRRFAPNTYVGASGKRVTYLEETQPEELLESHCSNWSTNGLLPGQYGLVMGVVLWFASMALGGIHAAAWHDYFPSTVEAWLWRCSALYITWAGLLWLLINLTAQMWQPFDDYWNRMRLHRPPFARSVPIVAVGTICGLLYIFARIYLVVEAFISIRKLPISAYQTPDWTQMIPHL